MAKRILTIRLTYKKNRDDNCDPRLSPSRQWHWDCGRDLIRLIAITTLRSWLLHQDREHSIWRSPVLTLLNLAAIAITTPRWVQSRCDRDFIDRIAIMTLRSHIGFFAVTIIALMIAITSPRSLYRRRDRDHHAAISTMPRRSRFHRQDRNPAPEIAEAIFQIAPRSRSSRWDRYYFAAIAIIASLSRARFVLIASRLLLSRRDSRSPRRYPW